MLVYDFKIRFRPKLLAKQRILFSGIPPLIRYISKQDSNSVRGEILRYVALSKLRADLAVHEGGGCKFYTYT